MPDMSIKANDTLPFIEATLGYAGLRTVPDLTSANTAIWFIMRAADENDDPAPGVTPKVRSRAQVIDPATARVRYSWTKVDTNEPGQYLGEWQVAFGDGTVQTFPLSGYHTIHVLADLDEQSGTPDAATRSARRARSPRSGR